MFRNYTDPLLILGVATHLFARAIIVTPARLAVDVAFEATGMWAFTAPFISPQF